MLLTNLTNWLMGIPEAGMGYHKVLLHGKDADGNPYLLSAVLHSPGNAIDTIISLANHGITVDTISSKRSLKVFNISDNT